MNGHKLVINSLHDLDCSCECGMWSIVSTGARDSDANEDLRKWAKEKHAQHLKSIRRRLKKAGAA